jgi:menaquinone-dependent protoporphyrinogen oxidase
VLGSAVFDAQWRPEAVRFASQHGDALSRRPVWLFESGWVGKRPETLTTSR